jgi:hypothetical protein
METRDILARWIAIETGGIDGARRRAKQLSLAAFVLCVGVALVSGFIQLPGLAYVIPGALIGWLVAERNALESRCAQWATFRKYIDWPRVHEDLRRHAETS